MVDQSLHGQRLVNKACTEPALSPLEPHLSNLVKLRNLLKHNEHVPLAEPTQAAIELVRSVLALLRLSAIEIAAKPVYTITEDERIDVVTSMMQTNVYTAVPVMRKHRIIGVFSEATAVRLLARSSRDGVAVAGRVGDMLEFLDQPDQSDDYAHYRCTGPSTAATDVVDWFGDSTTAGIRLNAVFVTATGAVDDPPAGVITAWDLRNVAKR